MVTLDMQVAVALMLYIKLIFLLWLGYDDTVGHGFGKSIYSNFIILANSKFELMILVHLTDMYIRDIQGVC